MERIRHTVHTLREKPAHVRERIAVGASAGITGLVALIWAVSVASSGVLALDQQPAGEAAGQNLGASVSELMGAVGALTGASTSAPELTIVDGPSGTTRDEPSAPPPSATVIPF
jgi:hypothetical protein